MTLFSIDNLAQSDCKPSRFSPEVRYHPKMKVLVHREERSDDRSSSPESSTGALSPSDNTSSGASSICDSPPSAKKPPHSYIALIAMAIINSQEKRLLLCDIYEYIMKHFPFFKDNERSWRNSIRHNLSLNECFIKAGRSGDGRGHFWAIHPANLEDFAKGDYRRRQARRRARSASYSPYAYPSVIPGPIHPGYIPMTYAPHPDMITKSHLAMFSGVHPLTVSTHHPVSAALYTPPHMPTSHPYCLPSTVPAAYRPSIAERIPLTIPSPMFSNPMTSSLSSSTTTSDAAGYRLAHGISPSVMYPSYSKSSSPPSMLPTASTAAWSSGGSCDL
nr:forkhead box protein E3-like [Lytechinus pictus]